MTAPIRWVSSTPGSAEATVQGPQVAGGHSRTHWHSAEPFGQALGVLASRSLERQDVRMEELLSGGNTSAEVVKIGSTVRRPTGPWTSRVHELLRHLESRGFEGAPR